MKPSAGAAFARLAGAGVLLYLSWQLWRTWNAPLEMDDGDWVGFGVGLILLEFIFVHSAPFFTVVGSMAKTRAKRFLTLGGLLALYSLFALGMLLAVDAKGLAAVYAGVMLTRFGHAFFDTIDDAAMGRAMGEWALSVVFYLFAVSLPLMVDLPTFGLEPELGRKLAGTTGEGVWEAEPHRALASGVIHFGLMGLAQLAIAYYALRRAMRAG